MLGGLMLGRILLLAEVTLDGDLSTYAWEALLFLLLLGGTMYVLSSIVSGRHSVSSGSSPARKNMGRPDGLTADSPAANQSKRGSAVAAARNSPRGSAKDKRRDARRGGNSVPILVSDPLAGAEPIQAAVLNRSRGGLCLLATQPS